MAIPKFPKENDLLLFEDDFAIRLDESTLSYSEIEKGTLARVLKVRFVDDSYTDEVLSDLVILIDFKGQPKILKFNYALHHTFVSIVPEGKITEILYSKR